MIEPNNNENLNEEINPVQEQPDKTIEEQPCSETDTAPVSDSKATDAVVEPIENESKAEDIQQGRSLVDIFEDEGSNTRRIVACKADDSGDTPVEEGEETY